VVAENSSSLSTEAEYMAITHGSKEAISLQNMLCKLLGKRDSTALYNDSQPAQRLASNHIFHNRMKHIDVLHHFVREAIQTKLIN
jgi:hypothetical protein